MRTTVLVLIPGRAAGPRGRPEDMPIGRAALALADEGVDVVFGANVTAGRFRGGAARPGSWTTIETAVDAVYDRFPSQKYPERYRALRAALGDIPIGNPEAAILLCRDKVLAQRVLEAAGTVTCPPIETDPARFQARLETWGGGFAKPRFGAFGAGVRYVRPGDEVPATAVGTLPGIAEPVVLQRAIPAPDRWAGVSVRTLCQRAADGAWVVNTPVARASTDDPVVNVHRGARAIPGPDLFGDDTLAALKAECLATCAALEATDPTGWLLELGIDLVVDPTGRPWVIEVNSRPRGRLEALASAEPERFDAEHLAACMRPLQRLAALAG